MRTHSESVDLLEKFLDERKTVSFTAIKDYCRLEELGFAPGVDLAGLLVEMENLNHVEIDFNQEVVKVLE